MTPCLIEQSFTEKAVPAAEHLEEQQLRNSQGKFWSVSAILRLMTELHPQSPIERTMTLSFKVVKYLDFNAFISIKPTLLPGLLDG